MTAIQWLPPKVARLTWFAVDVLLLGVIYGISFKIIYPDGRWTAHRGRLALATFVLTLGYVINQFQSGQPTTCWVALSMLTFYWAAGGKLRSAGVALSAAICIKVVPLCFAPHLIARGGKLAAASLLGGLATVLAVPAVWVGWQANARLIGQWVAQLHSTLMPSMLWEVRNQSLFAILFRFLSPNSLGMNVANLDMATVGYLWLGLTIALAVTMNAWFMIVLRGKKAERRDAAILSLLLIFMTICNPLAWKHNSIALVLPYFFVLDAISRSLERRRTLALLLVAAVSLIYLKGHHAGFAPLDLLQIYGGRFWGNLCLAAAVLVAYYAANASRIRIAAEPAPGDQLQDVVIAKERANTLANKTAA
jgi:hypothetical protein